MRSDKDICQVHDLIIDSIVNRLGGTNYIPLYPNLDYTNRETGECGEFDILALRNCVGSKNAKKYALLFEVKQSDRKRNRIKALDQLARGERLIRLKMGKDVRIFKLYAYSHKTLRRKGPSKPYFIERV